MLFVRHALFWFCTSFKLLFIISEISSFDSLLVTVWRFMLMKTFISTSCMFPVKISCFNGGIFHSDDIQHVIIVGVFTNDTIYTVLRFTPSVVKSIYCTKKAKNFSLLFQIFSWDMKSFGWFAFNLLPEREGVGSKIVLWFFKSWRSQMGSNFLVLFHHLLLLYWSWYLVKCHLLAPQHQELLSK